MKRLLSVLLSVVMVFTLSVPTLAVSVDARLTENKVILSKYQAKSLKLEPTETDSVFESASGKFYAQNGESYVAVTKTEIPFNASTTVQSALKSDDYSPKLKEAIQNYYEYATRENLLDDITMTIYTSPGFFIDEEGTEEHFGKEMRYQVVDYGSTSIPAQRLNDSMDAFEMVSTIADVAITGASLVVIGLGLVNPPAAAAIAAKLEGVSNLMTILDAIELAFPDKTFTGTTNDFTEILFHYHYYEKYVSVNTDSLGWCDALTSGKALVSNTKLRVCLYDDETLTMSDRMFVLEPFCVQGESYDDPWQTAFNHMFLARHEPAKIYIEDLTFDFGAFIWE